MLLDIHTHNARNENDVLRIVNYYERFERAQDGGACSLGIHPCHLDGYEQKLVLQQKLAGLTNVIAIGECGLDTICNKDATLQAKIFRQQLALAQHVKKPAIIHCVRAFDELIRTTDEQNPRVPIIVHGYNKKPEVAERLLAAGMHLSFGAAIMNDAWPAAQVLRNLPANRFFLETDDAEVTIHEIYERTAHIRKTDRETLILQLQQNFKDVFKRAI